MKLVVSLLLIAPLVYTQSCYFGNRSTCPEGLKCLDDCKPFRPCTKDLRGICVKLGKEDQECHLVNGCESGLACKFPQARLSLPKSSQADQPGKCAKLGKVDQECHFKKQCESGLTCKKPPGSNQRSKGICQKEQTKTDSSIALTKTTDAFTKSQTSSTVAFSTVTQDTKECNVTDPSGCPDGLRCIRDCPMHLPCEKEYLVGLKGKCAKFAKEDQECNTTEDCEPGLSCFNFSDTFSVDSKCVNSKPANLGEPCGDFINPCVDGLYCPLSDLSNATCKPILVKKPGEICHTTKEWDKCEPGYSCVWDSVGSRMGTCKKSQSSNSTRTTETTADFPLTMITTTDNLAGSQTFADVSSLFVTVDAAHTISSIGLAGFLAFFLF
jgi:hypothetical protein